MRLHRLSVGFLSVLVLVSCGRKGDNQGEQQLQEYPTMVVSAQDETLENVYPAVIKGQEDIEIRPRIDGFIDAIYVDEGSVVRKGQVLFSINSPQSQQSYTSAVAAVSSAEAQLNTAKLNVDRIRPLAEKGIVSDVQLSTYQNSYETAAATLSQAKATLANAQSTLGWTKVTSPVDGMVGSIPFRLGSLVNSSNVLTTVANTNNIYAYFSLSEIELMQFLRNVEGNTQAEKIKNLPPVTLTLKDKSVYPDKVKVETISGVVDQATGSASFRAEFPNRQAILRSGTMGNISIPRIMKDAIVIPQKATFTQQDKYLTYKVVGDSVVQTLITVVSTPDGKNYVVTSGLSEGDRIVTDGIITLGNGKKIIAK